MQDRDGNQQLHERMQCHLKPCSKSQKEIVSIKGGENFYAASNEFPHKAGAIQCPNKCFPKNMNPDPLLDFVKMKAVKNIRFCEIENLNFHGLCLRSAF